MDSETIRVTETPLAEIGRVTFEGRTFDAWGAVDSPDRLFCYVNDEARTVTSWDGSVTFGRIVRASRYTVRTAFGPLPARMEALRVRRPDGSLWHGRYGYDWRSCVTLRPMATH